MRPAADWAVVSVERMRALEHSAFAAGTSEAQLQANAAAQVADVAASMTPDGSRGVVLVGPGNNGRDAFLAGRLLAAGGRRVSYYLGPRHAITAAEEEAIRPGIERIDHHDGPEQVARLRRELPTAAVALDGLLGIGVRGSMRQPLDALANALNEAPAAHRPRVVAVDVPSGIDADSGAVEGAAVRADVTVALGAVKAGSLRFPAAEYVGRLEPRPIGLPDDADADCQVRLLSAELVAPLLPRRSLEAHKGTLGWVLVAGGSREYVGAPILAGMAAARSGCGLVALAVPPNVQSPAGAAFPEATYLLREGDDDHAQAERILARLEAFDSLILGPGLGRSDAADALVRTLLPALRDRSDSLAVVVDADALFTLAQWPRWWEALPRGCVLTPHGGEMARLSQTSAEDLRSRSWEIALERAVAWGQIIVLKGAHTVVAAPDGRAWVHPRANPGLATAGTGDVLAGLIGGLAAQGLAAVDAARLAVVAHGLAAGRVLDSRRWRSLIASDLLPEVPAVLRNLSATAGAGAPA